MPRPVVPPLDQDLREILGNLAEGLFDLAAWLALPDKYTPQLPSGETPWRAPGHRFTPADMGVVPFFEGLLLEASGDDDLFNRWAKIIADPLVFSPLDDAAGWRANRGLANPPQFGIAPSSNVLIMDAARNPVSRRKFYDACWTPLRAAVTARKQQGSVDWASLAKDLARDQVQEWPTTINPASSAFITQYTCDLLYAMLGMRNPVAPPTRYALLTELGEHRRVGNAFEPGDATAAVERLRKQLASVPTAPLARTAAPVYVPPVGSPPHDKV